MRIKSYFASSVQSAIAIARKEYGDDVTLVTSHTAPLESRHLGDYEVVFAVDETPLLAELAKKQSTQVIKAAPVEATAQVSKPAAVETDKPVFEAVAAAPVAVLTMEATLEPQPVVPMTMPFQDLLQEAIATPLSTEQNVPEKLDRVHSILVEMGIDAPMVRALMTMIERSVSAQLPASVVASVIAEAEVAMEAVAQEAEVVEPEPAAPVVPDLTPAELAFYLSVSVGS